MPAVRIRSAVAEDYPSFVRLFPELRVDDPMLPEARFAKELVPTTLFAEDENGSVLGYAFFNVMGAVAYVRHIATAPEARRRGVGRALMDEIAKRARAARATSWCLNVKPDNEPAIALYERVGLARSFRSRAMKIEWALVNAKLSDPPPLGLVVRLVPPEEESRVEVAMDLVPGQLHAARATPDRVLLMMEDPSGSVVGASIFHPHFPGAYPFRVARPELAFELLRAIRPHAAGTGDLVNVVSEGQPEVADALVAAGAIVRLEILHMKGPLPG